MKKNRKAHDEKYKAVAYALLYLTEKEEEEKKKELAKRKSQKVLLRLTFIGIIVMIGLSIVTNLTFDFSWMTKIEEWYSEIYISLMVYMLLTDIVVILERKAKFDQKPAFGYIWPFIGFFISMIISKTTSAYIVSGPVNVIISLAILGMFIGYRLILMSSKIGSEKAKKELRIRENALNILKENPEIVDEVITDFENETSTEEAEQKSKGKK